MENTISYNGGENFDLRQILLRGRNMKLQDKTAFFDSFLNEKIDENEVTQMRLIGSASDREVKVYDSETGEFKSMLMFGSNNYLGLANHPLVCQRAKKIIDEYGAGIGGPPLLNGYTVLHRELEEKLSELKGCEDALIFSSGYNANVGLVTSLMGPEDIVFYDAYSHASFCDGIKMAGVQAIKFHHNDMSMLERKLQANQTKEKRDIFIAVEGVYSMDGDMAPLDTLVELKNKYGAYLIVDDAHGTGMTGEHGRGTAEHFGVEGQVDIIMGTFSKSFAMTGGFVAASKPIINYMRFFARSYMFSASMSPVVIASVLAGLEVMENEPELFSKLNENIDYAINGLNRLGLNIESYSAIIPLLVPDGMNIRHAAYEFHKKGIFLNSIEYPAVPVSQQRFRISIMAIHTKNDIDCLLEAVSQVWTKYAPELRCKEMSKAA
jgi:glycine C-acetyltransferase